MDILTTPGLWTDLEDPTGEAQASWSQLRAYGFEWVGFQMQNGATSRPVDTSRAKAAGLSVGAWGVTYRATDFFLDGKRLAEMAVARGCTFVAMNAEFAAKDTRTGQKLKPIIDGCRAGGWAGPISLFTLGAPSVPSFNDFAMDTKSFIDTGGGVIAEAYSVETPDYNPANCVTYWTRFIARERLNICVGLYTLGLDRFDGAENAALLKAAEVGRAFSVYMIQHGRTPDWQALSPLTQAPPAPPTPLSSTEARARIVATVEEWEDGLATAPAPNTRLEVIKSIAATSNTDVKWNAAKNDVLRELDENGI